MLAEGKCGSCGAYIIIGDKVLVNKNAISHFKQLVSASRAVYGDLCAGDEEPNHYVSWGRLREALEYFRGVEIFK